MICATWIEDEAVPIVEVSHVLDKTGTYLRERAQYSEAEPLLLRALAIREQQLGPEHPDIAESLYGLAKLSQHQEKYERAESLYQRALAIRAKRLGLTHPDTQETRRDYAVFLRVVGRDAEAAVVEKSNEPSTEEGD